MSIPFRHEPRQKVVDSITAPTDPSISIEKANAASLTNSNNPFLKLPQEIHSAVFLHLIDPSKASKTSYVDHAGLQGLFPRNSTRHIQCSTPTLRSLLILSSTCKQLHSEFASTLEDLRSKTTHHFRLLDTEDFTAFHLFFRSPVLSSYRLTPHLKVTMPAKDHRLIPTLPFLSGIPAGVLNSLTLEISDPGRLPNLNPSSFLAVLKLPDSSHLMQIGSMVCSSMSHRRFDGMWTLRYRFIGDLKCSEREAWLDPRDWQDQFLCSWTDEGDRVSHFLTPGVEEWERCTLSYGDAHRRDEERAEAGRTGRVKSRGKAGANAELAAGAAATNAAAAGASSGGFSAAAGGGF